jgi:sulfite exporter TauE/SafE
VSSIEPILASALVLGFFGSVHCLGMCGGIAAALGQALPDQSAGGRLLSASVYSFGRVTSYVAAGAIVGFFGETFTSWTGLTVGLRLLAGLLIVGFGLHVAGWWNGLAEIERIGLVVWRRLSPLARRIGPPDRVWKTFALGMVWGWLPCGLVYAALIGAAATGHAVSGAVFMACFGLGTLPALLAASGFGAQLGAFLALRSARRAAGVLLLVFGFWSIAGALMPLHGGHDMHSMDAKTHEAHEDHVNH